MWCGLWRFVLPLCASFAAAGQNLVVYDDAQRNGFDGGFSYGGGVDLENAVPVQAGDRSIALSGNDFNALALARVGVADLTTGEYSTLRFFVHGGTVGGQQLRLFIQRESETTSVVVAEGELDAYIDGGAMVAGEWRQVIVPLAQFGVDTGFDRIDLQSDVAGIQPILYVDEIVLMAVEQQVFVDGFEGDDIGDPGMLRFTPANPDQSVGEASGSASFTVERVGGAAGAVGATVSTGGTASSPTDYTATGLNPSWASGEAGSKTITIAIVDDASDETDETVSLSLTMASGGATIGTPSSATLTILDDDLPPSSGTLLVETDVTVRAMTSDRFTWTDSMGQPRVAVLAHNDGQLGPTSGGQNRGGTLREYRYRLPGGAERVIGPTTTTNTNHGGFGYVVSHRNEGSSGIAGDDSPLGFRFSGSFERVATGRHHALFRFRQNYPRHSTTTAVPPNTRYQVPVTIDWFFATGRDHPLWAVTWDLGAATPDGLDANELNDDSRAPYGELLIDGAIDDASRNLTAGIAWGDRFRFTTPDVGPVTYNSPWTWNEPNTVPFVKVWTQGVDATMGTVQTQTIEQHDAGGYFGTSEWGETSLTVPQACTIARGGIDTVMPCDYNWPYQSINYEFNHFGNSNNTTRSTKLAWGTNFGFLGRTAYPIHGSSHPEIGGPVPGNPTASGWPRQSYSTYVVLGLHSEGPVEAQVAEIEAVQETTLTASVGTVAIEGPAGPGRDDDAIYQPAGWNHVYGLWTVDAVAGAADFNFSLANAATLTNPVIALRGWPGPLPPTEVRFNGGLLVPDVDYHASVFDDRDELLITLDRTLAGAANRVVVTP